MSIKLIKEKEEIFPINIKLKSVIVKRDYSLNGTLEVFFSDYNISVIYGENGCGKTTILRLINAFLSQNDSVFSQEKVKEMSIRFLSDGMEKEVVVSKKERKEIITDENDNKIEQISMYYDWSEYRNSPLFGSSSILFGVNRGIASGFHVSEDEIYDSLLRTRYREKFEDSKELMMFCHMLSHNLDMNQKVRRGRRIQSSLDLSSPVLNIDSVSMEVIEELLVERYRRARRLSIDKVQKALFDTLADACDSLDDIDITEDDYQNLLLQNKDRLILALTSGSTNTLSERIVNILKNVNEHDAVSEIGRNALLKKLIVNMSNELNQESEYIQAINRLTEIFNEYIGPDKYLKISEEEAIVGFHSSDETHRISALSSGERHLLVLLTIFVIEGNRRQLFMVDEPELSLNMIWQRKLLPLLSELAPNAEIVVASHSPSIAKANSNYLVELR